MNRTEIFPVDKVVGILEQARKAAEIPLEGPEGWSKSGVDPMNLFSVFEPLRLKQGFVFRAYQFREGGNGNGFVYAMPEHLHFPEPGDCKRYPDHFLEPPVPNGSLDDVMEAIEGDGSLWSYLMASLLRRELKEFGAIWHGCDWSTHEILGGNPLSPKNSTSQPLSQESFYNSEVDPREWEWLESESNEWSPTVKQEDSSITVMFHTYSGFDRDAIYLHIDRYEVGSYCFESECTTLAEGPGGYIF